MDKSCTTCANHTDTCKKCVTSGTFSGWTEWYGSGADLKAKDEQTADNINHPSHYTSGCGFECIEMMEMVFGKEAVHDFCTLNAFKYLWRYRQKGGTDDIGKTEWYLEYTKGLNVYKNRQAIDKMREHIEKEKGVSK